MEIRLNGELRRFDNAATVAALLQELGLDTRKIAVEKNREIVPKSTYGAAPIASGDEIEIVAFIGGG